MSGLAKFRDGEQLTCDECGADLQEYGGTVWIDLTYVEELDADVELIVGCENCPPSSSELLEAERVLTLLASQCGRCAGQGAISSEDIAGAREQWERFKKTPFRPVDVACPECADYRRAAARLSDEIAPEAA